MHGLSQGLGYWTARIVILVVTLGQLRVQGHANSFPRTRACLRKAALRCLELSSSLRA